MLRQIILPAVFLACAYGITNAQTRDTIPHEHPPLKPEAPPTSTSQPQLPLTENYHRTQGLIRIRVDAIPSRMRSSLESQQFNGWEESPMFHDERTGDFLIDIRSGDSLRTFRFNRDGDPVEALPDRK